MSYDKKGIIFEYTDLYWGAIILLLLIIFAVTFAVVHDQKERDSRFSDAQRAQGDAQGSILWHPGFLANTYTRYEVDGVALGEAIAAGMEPEEIEEHMDMLREQTTLHERYFVVFVLRDSERIYCKEHSAPIRTGARFQDTVTLCTLLRNAATQDGYGLENLKKTQMQRTDTEQTFISWTVTPGEHETVIGVAVK